jgi:hypothetical protein
MQGQEEPGIRRAWRRATIAGLQKIGDGVRDSNRELRDQLRDLKLEVARLGSVAEELRSAPVDIGARSLRVVREVN